MPSTLLFRQPWAGSPKRRFSKPLLVSIPGPRWHSLCKGLVEVVPSTHCRSTMILLAGNSVLFIGLCLPRHWPGRAVEFSQAWDEHFKETKVSVPLLLGLLCCSHPIQAGPPRALKGARGKLPPISSPPAILIDRDMVTWPIVQWECQQRCSQSQSCITAKHT